MSLVWYSFHGPLWKWNGKLYRKDLLPIFYKEGYYNYAKEAFLLIVLSWFLSERQVTELLWNHTVKDNVDKNFRPSHQREDKRTHVFISYMPFIFVLLITTLI